MCIHLELDRMNVREKRDTIKRLLYALARGEQFSVCVLGEEMVSLSLYIYYERGDCRVLESIFAIYTLGIIMHCYNYTLVRVYVRVKLEKRLFSSRADIKRYPATSSRKLIHIRALDAPYKEMCP